MADESGGDADTSKRVDLPDGAPSESPALQRDAWLSSLKTFAATQRQVAAASLTALTAAQRSIEQSAAVRNFAAAQGAIAKSFAQSIDFPQLTAKYNQTDTTMLKLTSAAQRWADSLSKAINLSALQDALASSAAQIDLSATDQALTGFTRQADVFRRVAESIARGLPEIDPARWIDQIDRWIPANLRGVPDLGAVATVALDEGVPLSWVPRGEIVVSLIDADGPQERLDILAERRDAILGDCEAALASTAHEWAVQCRSAIEALHAGVYGPAQSHASNIIDSIVLSLQGGRGRAVEQARSDFDNQPLRLAAENLSLRPLFRALTEWWPNSGTPLPAHFARHPTSHAVGQSGVFHPLYALIAVMLATSLTVQYEPVEPLSTSTRQV